MKVLQSFLASIVVFTRIPVAWQLPVEAFSRASLHLPLLGCLIGACQWLIVQLTGWGLSRDLALFFALIFPCLLSGAMHEDGLADFADGMLAGKNRQERLRIMKDPHLGSYGVMALLMVFTGSFLALRSTAVAEQGRALLLTAVFSRSLCIPLLATLPYISQAGSRSQGFIPDAPGRWRVGLVLWPLLPAFVWLPTAQARIAFGLLSLLLYFSLHRYLQKKLEGLTGDCLGAAIKIGDLGFLLLSSCLWPQVYES